MRKNATFSPCGKYRYTLERIWDGSKPLVLFVMQNPSTADESEDDRTITRCCDFARQKGFGGVLVGNLYALICTDSNQFLTHVRNHASGHAVDHPVGEGGPERDDVALKELLSCAEKTVVAWGADGARPRVRDRKREVLALLGRPLYALEEPTREGEPRHPSRLPKTPRWREYR